jgi:hypothetical protein
VPLPRDEVVAQFLRLPHDAVLRYNWGGYNPHSPDMWDVGDGAYISGVPLIVDLDLDTGYLVEVVERVTAAVAYLVVVCTPHGDTAEWWDGNAGTFYDRAVSRADIAAWATSAIHRLLRT